MNRFYIFAILILTSDAMAQYSVGRSKDPQKPSIQQVCPDTLFKPYQGVELEEHIHPLMTRIWTKNQLENVYAEIAKCLDPNTGPGFVHLWDRNLVNPEYPTILETIPNLNWVCRSKVSSTQWRTEHARGESERMAMDVFQCHRRAGWPTATDYSPAAQPLPRSDLSPQAQRNTISDKAGPFALSPENALRHCQNEAYVSGVRGDARKSFMTECIKSATANTPQLGGANNQSIGTSTTLKANSAVRDRPTNRPDTAPFIDPNCIDIKQTGKGISDMFKTVFSKCKVPVQVLFCFEDREKPGNDCKNTDIGWGVSSTIQPGRTDTLSSVPRSWTVYYTVCDMSNPKLLCVLP